MPFGTDVIPTATLAWVLSALGSSSSPSNTSGSGTSGFGFGRNAIDSSSSSNNRPIVDVIDVKDLREEELWKEEGVKGNSK